MQSEISMADRGEGQLTDGEREALKKRKNRYQ